MSQGAMVPFMVSFRCPVALVLLVGCTAYSLASTTTTGPVSVQPRREQDDYWQRQSNTSVLNTGLAFELYKDLATRISGQHQNHHNILLSPIGLVSILVLLSQVSGPESQNQVLGALGLAANATEESVAVTISTLADLLHNLTAQQGGVGWEVQRAALDGAGRGVRTGATQGVSAGKPEGQNAAEAEGGAEGTGRSEDRVHAGARLRVWSGLRVNGTSSPDYESSLYEKVSPNSGGSVFNVNLETLLKDMRASDKPELISYVYLKDVLPFERRPTVLQRFHRNATDSVDVAMMFGDDSAEMMMLYDTNCSATVVMPARSERLATLLLLPKAELQPLEECLSNSRMTFWLNNLKPGRAEILFPKFQLRKSYSLENLLRSVGITTVFSDTIDISRILQERVLRLVKGIQEVTLEVEETELDRGSRPDVHLDFSVPPRIIFNRPFMMIIYDYLTGLVLLMGRIVDPTDV